MRRDFEEFLIYKGTNDGSSERTVRAYRDILARFEVWLDGRDPWTLSGDELLTFSGPYLFKVLSLNPISRTPYVACIRQLYAWRSGVFGTDNPAALIPYPKKGRHLPRVMSLDNAERIMWSPDFGTFEGVRDAAMLGILIGCGLRVSGLIGLNESHITPMVVNGADRLAIKTREKGNKERILPIPVEADLLLRAYLAHPDLDGIDRTLPNGDSVLFVSTRNRKCPAHEYNGERRRFSPKGISAMIKRHGKRMQIPADQLHPHAIRHLYGTELAESQTDLLQRQQLLGHADPKSTEVYTHLAARLLTKTVDKANPLAKTKTPASQLLGSLSDKRRAPFGSS